MRVVVALPTPFSREGALDLDRLPGLLAPLVVAGANGVLLAGTTGEGAALTPEERRALLRTAREAAPGLSAWVGVLSPSAEEIAIEARRLFAEGAEAILAPPPFYEASANEAGVAAHFLRILDAASGGVVLYHIPSRARHPVTPSLLARLSGRPNLAGVKFSEGTLDEARALSQTGTPLYLARDSLLGRAHELRAVGVVTALGAAFPRTAVLAARGDAGAARRLAEVRDALRPHPLGAALKSILAARGLLDPFCRPPLGPPPKPEALPTKAFAGLE